MKKKGKGIVYKMIRKRRVMCSMIPDNIFFSKLFAKNKKCKMTLKKI